MKKSRKRKRKLLPAVFLTVFFLLFCVSSFQICYAADQEEILSEFEYGKIDDSLKTLFPEETIRFEDMVADILTGDLRTAAKLLADYTEDQLWYLLRTGKKNVVQILIVAVIAAFLNQFTEIFQNKQVAQAGFYMVYLLLATLSVAAFDVVLKWVETGVDNMIRFMGVFYPVYFLAVSVAKGSVTGVAFYQLVLFMIYLVEIMIGNVLLPAVRIYMIIRILNFLSPQDMLGKLAEFLDMVIRWTLKTVLACVIGANLVQGMISPAIDTVKRSVAVRGAEAVPGVGDLLGGMTEVALGTAVLVKNGIGIAGALVCTALCILPLIQTAGTTLLYKFAAAMIQPVSDERVTGCIETVGEGCQILLQIVFTTEILFLLTIAIAAAVTNI